MMMGDDEGDDEGDDDGDDDGVWYRTFAPPQSKRGTIKYMIQYNTIQSNTISIRYIKIQYRVSSNRTLLLRLLHCSQKQI